MKVKFGYIMREVAGNIVVVPIGTSAIDFSGVITLNETGAFLWKLLENEISEQELLSSMLKEYDIDEEIAKVDISTFLTKLKEADLFE